MTAPVREGREVGASALRSLRGVRDDFLAPGEALPILGGCCVVLAVCVGFFVFASHTDPDTWVPVLVAIGIICISLIICQFVTGHPADKRLRRILLIALLLKLLCAIPRYYVNEGYYEGEVDAKRYDQAGDFFVQNVSQGKWSIAGSELNSFPRETRIVGYITGVLYLGFGTSYFGGYLVFAWVCWLGLICFMRAFRLAYPNAPPYLVAKLLFFLPSLLFWPSSLGKDAVMIFLLGLLTLGVARILTRQLPLLGLLWVAAGASLMLEIRPHLLLVSVVGMAASTLSRPQGHSRLGGIVFRLLILAFLFPVLVAGINHMDSVLGTTGGGSQSLDQALNDTVARTNIGGSAFEAKPVRSPLDVPLGFITVIYRPFFFEARNTAVLISAAEGTMLIALTIGAARWIWRVGPAMYRSNFAAFCGAFSLGFVVAFSNIGNAGILSRQRVQLFPVLMLLVCAAKEHSRIAALDEATAEEPAHTGFAVADRLAMPGLLSPSTSFTHSHP